MKKVCLFSLIFILIHSYLLSAESLWNADSRGYLSGRRSLEKGDLVTVLIDVSSKLNLKASKVDAKTATLEFSGGEGGNPFSFLPTMKSDSNSNLKGEERLELSTNIVAKVEDVDETGKALLKGTKRLSVQGVTESCTVSGWVDPREIAGAKTIAFDRLGDAQLVYSSMLSSDSQILREDDFAAILQSAQQAPMQPSAQGQAQAGTAQTTAQGQAPSAPAAQPPGGETQAGAAPQMAQTQQPAAEKLTLTDAKKKELLLLYMNRFLDLIFGK